MSAIQCYGDLCDSPLGEIWFVVDQAGALLELQFQDGKYGAPNVEVIEERYAKRGLNITWDRRRLKPASDALAEYFAGERRDFDLPLAPAGTSFQKRVWAELVKIPYGTTCSYGALAAKIGQPNASRAVGLANGKNPIAIVIPCHRVIGSDGSLTGFAAGTDVKRVLLEIEGVVA